MKNSNLIIINDTIIKIIEPTNQIQGNPFFDKNNLIIKYVK
jgi:hypothetical protein